MNAGAYGGELSQILESVRFVDEAGQIRTEPAEQLHLSYRHSIFTENPNAIILSAVFMALGFMLLAVTVYIFPLTARYENGIKDTFKNALILAVAKLPYTVLMAAVIVAAVIASLWSTFTLMFALPLWLMIGGALIAWVNSYILRRVFVIFEGSESAAEEEDKG